MALWRVVDYISAPLCGAVELIEATGLEYTLSEDKTYYIVSEMGDCTRKHFIIPATHNGLPVKEIGEAAFYKKSDIIQVVLPDGIEKIGNSAFYQCPALKEVTFGENLLTIGDSAFYDCDGIKKIVVPDNVTSIGNSAFAGWIALTDATIGNSVESIGSFAFAGCKSLKGVYITDIEAWCNIAFGNEEGNPLRYARNLYLNNELVTDLVIPDSVTNIGNYAFDNCSSLTSITIPEGVKSIGENAFYNCSQLTDINYNGTMEEWNKIVKAESWDYQTGNYVVHCTDGDIKKS